MDTSKLFSLEGRIALVTGGSRGLGKTMADALISQGAKVYISSRKADACAAAAAELGPNCHALPQDVSTVEGTQALAAALAERESQLDILVNNAGVAWGSTLEDYPEAGWDKVMDLNLKSPFFLTQALLPLLRASGASGKLAKVINITSMEGQRLKETGLFSYSTSKAGLIHLTRYLAAFLVKDGIVVTSIAPGDFPSDMNRAARDTSEKVGNLNPLGRVGTPEDIAAALIYLAARSGDFVVGETLTIDGGMVRATLQP